MSLPSSLVRQRPDIRAAEELLHAACARVGVATANLYPQITLTGSLGSEATRIQDLFGSGTSVWSLGAGLLQPIFRGGELTAKRRAAIAAYDQAEAQYRETVLQAFQNVADVLRALELDARTLRAQADAEAAARDSLDLAREAVPARRGELSLPAQCPAPVPAGADQPGPGAGTRALPTPRRCSRRWAADGGTVNGSRSVIKEDRSNLHGDAMKKRILLVILGLVILIAVLSAVKALQIGR